MSSNANRNRLIRKLQAERSAIRPLISQRSFFFLTYFLTYTIVRSLRYQYRYVATIESNMHLCINVLYVYICIHKYVICTHIYSRKVFWYAVNKKTTLNLDLFTLYTASYFIRYFTRTVIIFTGNVQIETYLVRTYDVKMCPCGIA